MVVNGDLAGALETLARIEAGQKALAQKVAAIEAALARLAGPGVGRSAAAPAAIDTAGDDMLTEAEVITG